MHNRVVFGLAGALLVGLTVGISAGTAEASLMTYDPSGVTSNKLFTTEVKFDQNVNNGATRGRDVFLRNGDSFTGPNADFTWPASGTTFDWSLSYDGNTASFVFGGLPALTLDVAPDGVWNAFRFDLRSSDDTRFDSASVTVDVTEVNGGALGTPETLSASLNDPFAVEDYQFMGFQGLTSLTGTMRFDYEVANGATGSPNGQLRFNIKALSVLDPPTTTDLPEPATFALFALGLVGLAAATRRSRLAKGRQA